MFLSRSIFLLHCCEYSLPNINGGKIKENKKKKKKIEIKRMNSGTVVIALIRWLITTSVVNKSYSLNIVI